LAILPTPSRIRLSKAFSIAVVGAFVNVTKLTAVQDLQWLNLYTVFGQLLSRVGQSSNQPYVIYTACFPSISAIYTVSSMTFNECFEYGWGAFQCYQFDGGRGNERISFFEFGSELDNLATLHALSTMRTSTCVPTSVGVSIAKVPNVIATQILKWLTA